MQTKIVRNEGRKTLTLIISPISISFVDYLYEKYNNERYFASAVLVGADYTKDLVPFIKNIVDQLNAVSKDVLPAGESFNLNDLISLKEDVYRLFGKNTIKDKEWDKTFKVNLSSKSNAVGKHFLFEDLQMQKPIAKEDGWKHYYAVELELSGGYDEDNLEKYVFAVFHRGISVGEREVNYAANDSAWDGFNFNTDDLPF